MSVVVEPITRLVPGGTADTGPDADWDTVRARVVTALTALVPETWTDHNASDPGITLAEVAAFGLADLHYRAAERRFDAWPLEEAGWLSDVDRHWHHAVPADALEDLAAVAAVLAGPATSATSLERLVRAAASPADATSVLARAPWATAFTVEQRPVVVALTRGRLVRQVAQEQADLIARAVAAQRGSGDDPVSPVATRDERAAAELAFSLPLWEEEIRAVVRRERRRLSREALVERLAEVRAVTAATRPAVAAALGRADLSPEEVRIALAAGTQPPGLLPEDLESPEGRSQVWPPHPVQALTCEPVTAADYARRARAHPDVVRAWAVPGRLAGVAWNGLPTGATADVAVDEQAAALTLVVERRGGGRPGGGTDEFLRDVLATAIGPEVRAPFPDWRERAEVDDLAPRRMVCDEVGAALVAEAPVVVEGTIVTGLGADGDALVDDVRSRIAAFFAAGRPEARAPSPSGEVDGPWPRLEQPPDGWVPGEPIRHAEVVQAMVANPDVWGVEQLALRLATSTTSVPQSAGFLDVPRDAVPVLADVRCLRLRFSLTGHCDA